MLADVRIHSRALHDLSGLQMIWTTKCAMSNVGRILLLLFILMEVGESL